MFIPQLEFSFAFSHSSDTEVPFHRHDCYELVYYFEGAGTSTIGTTDFPYSENTFSLIEPGTPHNEIQRGATDLVCVGFPLNNTGSRSLLLENGIYTDSSFALLQIVKKMRQELLTRRIHYRLKLELLMNEFLIEWERTRTLPGASDRFDYIENFIHDNFNQDIHLPSLAKMSGYSYDHFRHLFKLKTGESPMSYIIHKKVEQAKKLMLSTDLTMSAISQDCGFSNSSQFSGIFRKVTGHTPSPFKRKNFIK